MQITKMVSKQQNKNEMLDHKVDFIKFILDY